MNIDNGSPDPDEIVTTQQEQLDRSAEMEAMGVHNWVKKNDQRDPDEQPKQVKGVFPTALDDTPPKKSKGSD